MDSAKHLVPGVDYPRTFREVDEWFRSDAECRKYIRRLRWPTGFICPRCRGTGEPWVTSRGLLHCPGCQGQTSLTAGTIFQDTRKPFRMWFMAMWYVTSQKNGVSALGPQESPHFYNSGSCVDSRRFSTKSCIAAGGEGFVEKSERWLGGRLKDIRSFICELYGGSVHSKRVDALASATLGVMASASLAVAVIGQALALARGLVTKHAIKQVDRLLSNEKIDVWESFAHWVPHLVGTRREIVVAMDWTDFDHDGQATLAFNLVTSHGRATPLLWLSVWKEELAEQRNAFEDACLVRLSEVVPPGCHVTILADRGFGDHKLFKFLTELGFGYVIRFRGNIHVTDETGETRPAAEWVGKSGRARKLRGARVTAGHAYQVGAVVCVQARAMKEPWCLAVSDADALTATLVNHYAKRWTIEPNFRDTKDPRFGMGLSETRIGEPTRRDRLLLINAFAMALLTMLGAAGESLGMDRLLKSNTSKKRTHSLFRQGCMLYELIPTMPEHRLAPLMTKFAETVSQCGAFCGLFAVV